MKRMMGWALALFLLLGNVAALATTANAVAGKNFDAFEMHCAGKTKDGLLLFGGSYLEQGKWMPTIMGVNTKGTVQWTFQQESLLDKSYYRDVKQMEDGSLIALRSNDNSGKAWLIEHIVDRQVIQAVEVLDDVWGAYPMAEGFLVSSKKDAETATIRRMDFSGQEIWKKNFDKYTMIYGIISSDNMHVAMGSRMQENETYGDRGTGIVFAFDDAGEILWGHVTGQPDSFLPGVWAEAGSVVLVGNTSPNEPDEDIAPGFICKYNKDGLVWRKDYNRVFPAGGMVNMIAVADGYMVVSAAHETYTNATFSHFDMEGNLKSEMARDLPSMYVRGLFCLEAIGNKIFFVASGKGHSGTNKVENQNDLPNVAMIQEIRILQAG